MQALKEDFTFFRKAMEDVHPSLYRYMPKDSVDHLFNAGSVQIDHPMDDIKFWMIVEGIVAKLGSGHTNIAIDEAGLAIYNLHQFYTLPFNVYIRNNKLFVKDCDQKDTTFKIGDKIQVIKL